MNCQANCPLAVKSGSIWWCALGCYGALLCQLPKKQVLAQEIAKKGKA